jgi:hypothetical protein
MAVLRSRGFNAHHLIQMVKRTGDPSTLTGLEKLKFITFGTPILSYIFHQINSYVLPPTTSHAKRKLLLCEDVPLSAQFWEMAINLTYVQTAVLHAGLTDSERVSLVKRFNDPKDELTILIIMHSVSTQGVNLDRCCSRVLVVTNATKIYHRWVDRPDPNHNPDDLIDYVYGNTLRLHVEPFRSYMPIEAMTRLGLSRDFQDVILDPRNSNVVWPSGWVRTLVFNPTRPDEQNPKPSPRVRAPELAQGSGSDRS